MVLLSVSMLGTFARDHRVVRLVALYTSSLFAIASVISVMACGGGAPPEAPLTPDFQEARATAEPTALRGQPTEEASEGPTPTPRPTATLEPMRRTPRPTSTPVPHGTPLSFPMEAGVSGREFISRLSQGEADCIQKTRGPDGLASFLDSPIYYDKIRSHTFQACLSDLSKLDLPLAFMSWDAGPLTDDQVACGREKMTSGGSVGDCLPWEMTVRLRVARVTWDQPEEVRECLVSAHLDNDQRHPFPFTAPDVEEVTNERSIRFALEALLCLPDDLESGAVFQGIGRYAMADIFSPESILGYPDSHPGATDNPKPSDLRCVAGTDHGRESMFAMVTPASTQTLDTARIYDGVTRAYAKCGISPLPEMASATGIDLTRRSSVGDIISQLTDHQASCTREEAAREWGGNIEGLLDSSAIELLSTLPEYLPDCIGLETATALTAEAIEAATGDLSHALYCVQAQVQEGYTGPSLPFVPPGYTRCLDEGQRTSLYLVTLLFGVGGVTQETGTCVREIHQAGMGVSEQLGSWNPQDSLAIAYVFTNATLFLCMSDEQILEARSVNEAPPGYFDCMRELHESSFRELYTTLGKKMFSDEGMSADEKAQLDHFLERLSGCEDILRTRSP